MSEKQKVSSKAAPAKKSQRKKSVRKKASIKSESTARKKRSGSSRKTPVDSRVAKESLESNQVLSDESSIEQSPPLEKRFFSYEDGEQAEELDNVNNQVDSDPNTIVVKLSQSLIKKITRQAEEEGISVNDFASELLSEGVVLRAWEILERKNQLRGSSSPSQGNHGRSQQNRGSGGRQKGHRGGMSHGRYQAIMDDKATFLEYVRNQERSRR